MASVGLLVRPTGWSASSDVQRNQPGQAADSKLVVGPLSERMKAKRLSCSLFWFKSVMFTAWKSRRRQVRAEEQRDPCSPPCHLAAQSKCQGNADLAKVSWVSGQPDTRRLSRAYTLIWGHLTTVSLGQYVWQTHGTINRGQGLWRLDSVVSAPLKVQQLDRVWQSILLTISWSLLLHTK